MIDKPQFKLPETKMCIVVWYRDNKRNETLIATPANNDALYNDMVQHRVGCSEIRAVKAVRGSDFFRGN